MNRLSTLLAAAVVAAQLQACGHPTSLPTADGPRDLGPLTAASFKGHQPVVSMAYADRGQLSKLAELGMEIWYVDKAAHKVFGQLKATQLNAVKALGLAPHEVTRPGLRNSFDAGYHTYEQVKSELMDLAAKYPTLAKVEDIGDSWEKTKGKADHDILALHISTGDASGKPALLFCGNHHARELVTPEMVLKIAHMLLEGHGTDADLTGFVENRDIYLVPMVNPDGHHLAEQGADWRKNTNTTTGGGADFSDGPSGPGVDLNRNYGFHWGTGGASADPEDATFRGPAAFSEPEVQAIKGLVERRPFTFLMTYHSFSNLILWPWGYQNAPPPDKRLPAIGMQLGKLSGYTPEQSIDLYQTSGDTTDWAFGARNVLAYTTEIGTWGDGFDPPYAKVATFWKQNEPGARLLLNLAANPAWTFGQPVEGAIARGGQLEVTLPAGARAAEAFVGREGKDGSGIPLVVKGDRAAVALPGRGGKQLVLVHAMDAQGHWGPTKALFN